MITVRQISKDEIDDLLDFLRSIAEWLNETGKTMWNIDRLSRNYFVENNRYDECYFGVFDGVSVASMILKEVDDLMWPEAEKGDAIYIGKLGVAREYSGSGYAEEWLKFAYYEAQRRGRKFLRLDCYANREYLCNLYENFGFHLIEKREMKLGLYAALYELKVE